MKENIEISPGKSEIRQGFPLSSLLLNIISARDIRHEKAIKAIQSDRKKSIGYYTLRIVKTPPTSDKHI